MHFTKKKLIMLGKKGFVQFTETSNTNINLLFIIGN